MLKREPNALLGVCGSRLSHSTKLVFLGVCEGALETD
jgi:hypothetical protein